MQPGSSTPHSSAWTTAPRASQPTQRTRPQSGLSASSTLSRPQGGSNYTRVAHVSWAEVAVPFPTEGDIRAQDFDAAEKAGCSIGGGAVLLSRPSRRGRRTNAGCGCTHFEALAPVGLHEARHSYSSYLDRAGVSEVRCDRYMGHSSGSMRSRYTHQLADQLAEDAKTLNAYLVGTTSGKVVSLPTALAK